MSAPWLQWVSTALIVVAAGTIIFAIIRNWRVLPSLHARAFRSLHDRVGLIEGRLAEPDWGGRAGIDISGLPPKNVFVADEEGIARWRPVMDEITLRRQSQGARLELSDGDARVGFDLDAGALEALHCRIGAVLATLKAMPSSAVAGASILEPVE